MTLVTVRFILAPVLGCLCGWWLSALTNELSSANRLWILIIGCLLLIAGVIVPVF